MVCCEQGVALNIIRYEATDDVNILKYQDDVLLPPNEVLDCVFRRPPYGKYSGRYRSCVKMVSVKTIVSSLCLLLNDK